MDKTRYPLDAIRVDESNVAGYLFWDVSAARVVITEIKDSADAINRKGDTIEGPIFYTDDVKIEDANQLVDYGYLLDQVDLLLQLWPNYLAVAGGQMLGPLTMEEACHNENGVDTSVATCGIVDHLLDPKNFIKIDGGQMLEGFKLFSDKAEDYGKYDAIPKLLVDELIEAATNEFRIAMEEEYLRLAGGKMTGPLLSRPGCDPSKPNHILTKEFVERYAAEYVNTRDWSCVEKAESV